VKEIKLEDIKSKVFERSEIDEEKMKELVQSVENIGIAQPILVRPTDDGYEVVAGGRRSDASKEAGAEKVPAVVKDMSDREALELMLTENIHREDLNDVDKGEICKMLLEHYPGEYPSQKALGERLGFSQHRIREWINLTKMTEGAKEKIAPVEKETKGPPKGKVSSRVATEIQRKIEEPDRQEEFVEEFAKRGTSLHKGTRVLKKAQEEPDKSAEEIFEESKPEPELIFREQFREPILSGEKTQTIRPTYPQVKEGDRVWAHFTDPKPFKLEIKKKERKRLGELTDEDAKREGVSSLEEFREIWEDLYGEWKPERKVYVVQFEKTK